MISFNSNIAALNAQRRLTQTSSALGRNFERLSTGLRINRASDDSAGLAIAERLRVDGRLYQAALRNTNDGLSMINIMDGAIEQQSNILTRLSELAEQSANGTLSNRQRGVLNQEYQSLITEFSRIASTTSFNGQTLLLNGRGRLNDGTGDLVRNLSLQVGVDASSNSQLSLTGIDTGVFSGTISTSSLAAEFSGFVPLTEDQFFAAAGTSASYVKFNDAAGVSHEGYVVLTLAGNAGGLAQIHPYLFLKTTNGAGATMYQDVSLFTNNNFWTHDSVSGDFLNTDNGLEEDLILNLDPMFVNGGGTFSLDVKALKVKNSGSSIDSAISLTGVETKQRGLDAIRTLRNRLQELASVRGNLGSMMSRLGTTASVLSVSRENVEAADSRIRDVDVAEESALLVANRIRQQMAATILWQANQGPGLLLSLLR